MSLFISLNMKPLSGDISSVSIYRKILDNAMTVKDSLARDIYPLSTIYPWLHDFPSPPLNISFYVSVSTPYWIIIYNRWAEVNGFRSILIRLAVLVNG